jgi:hypothetical protein
VRERGQRVDNGDQIERSEFLDKRLQRTAQRNHHLRRLVDVVVVEEQHEQAHIVAGGLHGGVFRRSNLDRLPQVARRGAVQPDELGGFDDLRNAVFLDQKVGRLQSLDNLVVAVDHRHVDADDVDLGAEDGLLRRVGRFLGILARRHAAAKQTGGRTNESKGETGAAHS